MLQTLLIHPCSRFPCILPAAALPALSCSQQQAGLAPALRFPNDGSRWEMFQPEPSLSKTWGPGIWGQPDGQAVHSARVTSAGQLEQSRAEVGSRLGGCWVTLCRPL